MMLDKQIRRADFGYILEIPTRWRDVDMYSHVNNVVYYAYFDTVIGHYLMTEGSLDYTRDDIVGFAVESGCQFFKPLRFPEIVEAGLRVKKLGNSSVRYEIGIFRQGEDDVLAVGYFVHVFVNRTTNASTPLPTQIRTALAKIQVIDDGE